MARRLSLVALAVGTVVVGAAFGGATSATAATGSEASESVLLSTDGVNFSRSIERVFDSGRTLIPGGSLTASVWIKNDSPMPAEMRVSLSELHVPSAVYGNAVSLSVVDPSVGSLRTDTLATLADCDVLVPSQSIAAGEAVRIDLGVEMGDLDGMQAQNDASSLDLLVSLRDDRAGAFPSSACEDDGVLISSGGIDQSRLAYTGSEPPSLLLAAGGALLGFGILLTAAARRRSRAITRPEPSADS